MGLVDASVWIDFYTGVKNPHTDWLDWQVARVRIGLTDLNLCEFLQGVRGEAQAQKYLRSLEIFELFSTGGKQLAIASVRNYRYLREKGVTVRKPIDCIIATYCLSEGHMLLHRDRDFEPFEKYLALQVIHP